MTGDGATADELPTAHVVVDFHRVARYRDAIGASPLGDDATVPRSLASWYLVEPLRRFLSGVDPAARLGVPGARLVLGELAVTIDRPPAIGSVLEVTGTVAARRVRGDKEFVELACRAVDVDGRAVAAATLTIVAIQEN